VTRSLHVRSRAKEGANGKTKVGIVQFFIGYPLHLSCA